MSPRLSVLALAALSLCGCALLGGRADQALRRTPSFRDGYQDGCAAATDAGADLRDRPSGDNSLYQSDAVYRRGWANGYQACRSTLAPEGNGPGSNPILNPSPGHQ